MKPLFDFNEDGKTDALELLIATAGDPANPLFKNDDDYGSDDNDYPKEDTDIDLGYLEPDDDSGDYEFEDDFGSIWNNED